MALLATRFCGPVLAPGVGAAQFTVPAGRRYLVRCLNLVNTSSTASIIIHVHNSGSTGGTKLHTLTIPLISSVILQPWWVFNAGEYLAFTGNTGTLCLSASGYDLLV